MSSIDANTLRSPAVDRWQRLALVGGAAGLLLTLVLAAASPRAILPSYLVAFLFWIGLTLGCVALTLLHHLVGGTWGLPVRRPMESGAMALLPMAVLFVPLLVGLRALYPWARPEAVAASELLQHKAAYLNVGAFVLRTVVYFAIWAALAFLLNRWSKEQDRTVDVAPTRRLQTLSGPGLGIVFFTASFAAIDWSMSLEPEWYSSIYGVQVIIGWGLETLAFLVLFAGLLGRVEPAMRRAITPDIMNDLGNLMLAFTMLWAYMSFSQFLIIWCGNLTEEIPYYLRRTHGGWQYFALALILFHFFAPFFFLLFRESKRRVEILMWVAAGILVMHVVDLSWLVIPSRIEDPLRAYIPWFSLVLVPAAWVGIGGIWIATFLWQLKGRSIVPLHTPEIDPEHELRTTSE